MSAASPRQPSSGSDAGPPADGTAGAIESGHYYTKQLGCKSGLIAWSHRSRFEKGLELIGPAPQRLLDYGSGDGTFLAMAAGRVGEGWGADVAADQVLDCKKRFAEFRNLHFLTVGEAAGPEHAARFDVVTCMETLEHCTAPIVEHVLGELARLAAPGGRVVISVPIEIGPTFLLKYAGRALAARRGLSDYRYYESYPLRDALRMILAGPATAFDRPAHGDPPTHTHYGFNWRALRVRVRAHLDIEKTLFTPLGFLGGWVSSQVWFCCRPRPRPGATQGVR